MSWSVQLVGTPEGVVKELEAIGEAMSAGQSKDEFMEAKPHLQGPVGQVVGQNKNIKLAANGHATFKDGAKTDGNLSVALDCFYGKWCG